ncbi:hypothetical protein MMC08_008314, partial [Hypocenomyce scalaris]|nr:hypothetical protein [Hypocenomyce scalaris]
LAFTIPAPQLEDYATLPQAESSGPAVTALSQPVTYTPTRTAYETVVAATSAAADSSAAKRQVNNACAPQPSSSNPPMGAQNDTPADFETDPILGDTSINAPVPNGYTQSFSNLNASVSAPGYLGLYLLDSYDPSACAAYCGGVVNGACQGFDIYFERDPSLDPADTCSNPPADTNIRCTHWGFGVDATAATNTGQYRDQFQVVIAGSNGYNTNRQPPAMTNFTGPTALPAAINAPLSSGAINSFQNAFDVTQCAVACQGQTAYDHIHATKGVYNACNFFNAYILSENNVPQGLYCSFYTQSWGPSYATNTGQTRGTDVYTVSESYSYYLTVNDTGMVGS